MTEALSESITDLIANPPRVHLWDGKPEIGGMDGDIATTLATHLKNLGPGFRSIETGAGLSTLVILASEPSKHITIATDADVRMKLEAEISARDFDAGPWEYHPTFSELALPKLAETDAVDIALMDGGHGWPTVFVDFCYMNMMLRDGGIMVVDDVQFFAVKQLFEQLKMQAGFELIECLGDKTAFIRKTTANKMLPDFGGQPYLIKMNEAAAP